MASLGALLYSYGVYALYKYFCEPLDARLSRRGQSPIWPESPIGMAGRALSIPTATPIVLYVHNFFALSYIAERAIRTTYYGQRRGVKSWGKTALGSTVPFVQTIRAVVHGQSACQNGPPSEVAVQRAVQPPDCV